MSINILSGFNSILNKAVPRARCDNRIFMTETVNLVISESGHNYGVHLKNDTTDNGYTLDDLMGICRTYSQEPYNARFSLYMLHEYATDVPSGCPDVDEAYVLVWRNYLNRQDATDLYKEQVALPWDTKYYDWKRNKVLHQHSRKNLRFGEDEQKPEYENGKETIIPFRSVPCLQTLRNRINKTFDRGIYDMNIQSHRFYDPEYTGIGWHGNEGMCKQIGLCLGINTTMKFRWWYDWHSFGKTVEIPLQNGDLYIVSKKAVGSDWRKRKIATLRNSIGSEKFTKVKMPKLNRYDKNI